MNKSLIRRRDYQRKASYEQPTAVDEAVVQRRQFQTAGVDAVANYQNQAQTQSDLRAQSSASLLSTAEIMSD